MHKHCALRIVLLGGLACLVCVVQAECHVCAVCGRACVRRSETLCDGECMRATMCAYKFVVCAHAPFLSRACVVGTRARAHVCVCECVMYTRIDEHVAIMRRSELSVCTHFEHLTSLGAIAQGFGWRHYITTCMCTRPRACLFVCVGNGAHVRVRVGTLAGGVHASRQVGNT